MSSASSRRKAAYFAFTAALGVAGWGALIGTAMFAFGPPPVARPELSALLLFAIVIVAGRVAAVRTAEGQVLALDAAFYIAAAVCVGTVLAAGLVALALTVDAGLRLVRARPKERARGLGWWGGLCYVIFFGGTTGALILVIGWLFELDSLYTLVEGTDLVVLSRLLVAGGLLVAAHYMLQGVRRLLAGGSLRTYGRRVALPGFIAELSLMPLAAIIVYVYDPNEPLRFALLGVTYVVINFAFNRIYATGMSLRRRVADLEILNETSRALAASLQGQDVLESVALSVTRALPGADDMLLVRRDTDGELVVDRYRSKGRSFERAIPERLSQNAKTVMSTKRSLMATAQNGGDWLGVPLAFHGQVEGLLAVRSTRPGVFAEEHIPLLESIAGQASVALRNAELYELAMVDGLTGLFVRRYFDARLEEEILRSRRFDSEFSVVMMDVDNFKALNDRYGHLVGDRVLQGIAEVVRAELRGVDTGARYGGEEIAMILPRTPLVEAYNVAERIRSCIESLAVRGDAKPVSVTASFGIASFPESGAEGREGLVRRADQALYRAKRTGKNRVELYWSDAADERVELKLVDDETSVP